jgi:hypothetical protein
VLLQLFAQCLASPMQPDPGIVLSDAEFVRELADTRAVDNHASEHLGLTGTELLDLLHHAAARVGRLRALGRGFIDELVVVLLGAFFSDQTTHDREQPRARGTGLSELVGVLEGAD